MTTSTNLSDMSFGDLYSSFMRALKDPTAPYTLEETCTEINERFMRGEYVEHVAETNRNIILGYN